MAEVESFDKNKLKKTETKEKNPLPTKEGIDFTTRRPTINMQAHSSGVVAWGQDGGGAKFIHAPLFSKFLAVGIGSKFGLKPYIFRAN